jgi:hypothetical protein
VHSEDDFVCRGLQVIEPHSSDMQKEAILFQLDGKSNVVDSGSTYRHQSGLYADTIVSKCFSMCV